MVKQLTKKISYSALNTAIRLSRKSLNHSYDCQETILLSGTARGGTTLLAQIISTLPNTQILWEPLNPGNNRECEKFGFGWHHYITPDESAELQFEYIRKLICGEAIHTGTLYRSFFSFADLLRSQRLAIKFANANRILGWLSRNFSNPIVLQLRHPCAVIASQLNHQGFAKVEKRDWLPDWLLANCPEAEEVYRSEVNTLEEIRCWDWCIQTVLALEHCDFNRVHMLTYESLITNPEEELLELCRYLDEDVPDKAMSIVKKPSSTASAGAYTQNPEQQLNRWKERLTNDQAQRIQRLATRFGLEFYFNYDIPKSSNVLLNPDRELKIVKN